MTKDEELIKFAINISKTGAGEPSKGAKQLMRLYVEGILSLEEVKDIIVKRIKNGPSEN